jgi:hypothetical protein
MDFTWITVNLIFYATRLVMFTDIIYCIPEMTIAVENPPLPHRHRDDIKNTV